MAPKADPQVLAHLEWLGYVQPTGLVVSAHAMISAGAILDRADAEGHRLLRGSVAEASSDRSDAPAHVIPDFASFARDILGWSFDPRFYAGTPGTPIPEELEAHLPEHDETLRPDFAVREPDGQRSGWQLLVNVVDQGVDLDRPYRGHGSLEASPHSRLERLLRDKEVLAGLLMNGRTLRLISAPRGETSGWIDFRVDDMLPTAGRPICSALRLLLGQSRLLALPRHQRLTNLLEESRRYQNLVSERLAEQVLHALYELLRGFQAAHEASKGTLLRAQLESHPDEVYRGLLNVILRMVFLLYAEERDMFPDAETWTRYYSLAGLHERLREDVALYPDTMDQRYGAWAQLLVLFRLVHGGADLGTTRIPARQGVIFDPDRFPFLEGRRGGAEGPGDGPVQAPLVSDGTVFRALEKLLVLDGERISYRALDVEQIGSVYETMMGFRLETATGSSLAIRSEKRGGAPTTVDLDALRATPSGDRSKRLVELAGRKLTDRIAKEVRDATSVEALHAALLAIADLDAAPDLVPRGSLVLQPSDERRRSGSHYTPRSLTEPIVRRTLEPVLVGLREPDERPPRPDAILDLKVCDPAMGSGAFLVEVCRQLADALIEAWAVHGGRPELPSDEDEVVFARRIVAQRCLYGVDRNPMATDLAKVSLWLATLAREHPLTFLDHALRHGDSLVGLGRDQVAAFHWSHDARTQQRGFEALQIEEHLTRAETLRQRIREAREDASDTELRPLWDAAQAELDQLRLVGDLVVLAFFQGDNAREREMFRSSYAGDVLARRTENHRVPLAARRDAERPLVPFHWELEFPEVFGRANPGFDAFIGNPPFMAKNLIALALGSSYQAWLAMVPFTNGKSDVIAYFFRRTFDLARVGGAIGLVATNTIAQGDTRAAGLAPICTRLGGKIFAARTRIRWPGAASVQVSVVHILKGVEPSRAVLDGVEVDAITAYLLDRGPSGDPARLAANSGLSFQGCNISGQGFLFADDTVGATPTAVMKDICDGNPRADEVIFPYLGGSDVNTSPSQDSGRFVIAFGRRPLEDCRQHWPELVDIVEATVKPDRERRPKNDQQAYLAARWWQWHTDRPTMQRAIQGLSRVLTCSAVTARLAFVFVPTSKVLAHSLNVFALSEYAAFAAMQCRAHEEWSHFFSSSLEDRLRYTPSDCFETYPFPAGWREDAVLEAAGRAYYEHRAALMIRRNEGLTTIYNRFHDPDESSYDIVRLRELHATMDQAVLNAYGWKDIPVDCEFLLDHDDEADEGTRQKKPWRYRWPDDVREQVLGRLLELNASRAADEARAGAASSRQASTRRHRPDEPAGMDTLF